VKAIDVFIRAAAKVRLSHRDAHFIVVGKDHGEGLMLGDLARSEGITDSLHFLGERSDVPRLLRALDVGVISSRSESFSNSLMEYLAAGLPAVCTDVGGAREAIQEGGNGYVVPVGDPGCLAAGICRILRSGRRAEMGMASLEHARRHFSVEKTVRATEEMFIQATERSEQ
jgi:glycosyltransferase involved in cell wall biosynthesis